MIPLLEQVIDRRMRQVVLFLDKSHDLKSMIDLWDTLHRIGLHACAPSSDGTRITGKWSGELLELMVDGVERVEYKIKG